MSSWAGNLCRQEKRAEPKGIIFIPVIWVGERGTKMMWFCLRLCWTELHYNLTHWEPVFNSATVLVFSWASELTNSFKLLLWYIDWVPVIRIYFAVSKLQLFTGISLPFHPLLPGFAVCSFVALQFSLKIQIHSLPWMHDSQWSWHISLSSAHCIEAWRRVPGLYSTQMHCVTSCHRLCCKIRRKP